MSGSTDGTARLAGEGGAPHRAGVGVGSGREPQLLETHSAVLVMLGDRVHKLKKPVDLGFLDFSTVEGRRDACEREVRLNRRLAPDVYLGVEDLVGPDGEVCDHLVLMRRMPPARRLRACLERGEDVVPALRRIARDVAELHAASSSTDGMADVATRDAVAELWEDGLLVLERHRGDLADPDLVDAIAALSRRYLEGRDVLFRRRIDQGWIRDGHGDLQAEDVFLLDDGPRVLDCLEFADSLRWGDVLADVAFLAMDLERLGHPSQAAEFLDEYRRAAAASWPVSLEHHYIAYRALVRTKVGVIRATQTGVAAPEVDDLARLCRAHLDQGRVRMVLVGGLPGTGKSTTARELAAAAGARVLRSDELRRTLPEEGRYDPATTDAVYDGLLSGAAELLAAGEHVVADATWSDARHRDAARRTAAACRADLVEIECQLPAEVAAERIRRRAAQGADLSEATPEVARRMAVRFDRWDSAVAVDTGGDVAAARDAALAAAGWAPPRG